MLENDQLLTLTQLAQRVPGRPHGSTLWRWCRIGVKSRAGGRVRLEHMRTGARVFSSWEAYLRFGEALAAADIRHFAVDPDESTSEQLGTYLDRRAREAGVTREIAAHRLVILGATGFGPECEWVLLQWQRRGSLSFEDICRGWRGQLDQMRKDGHTAFKVEPDSRTAEYAILHAELEAHLDDNIAKLKARAAELATTHGAKQTPSPEASAPPRALPSETCNESEADKAATLHKHVRDLWRFAEDHLRQAEAASNTALRDDHEAIALRLKERSVRLARELEEGKPVDELIDSAVCLFGKMKLAQETGDYKMLDLTDPEWKLMQTPEPDVADAVEEARS